MWPQLIGAAIGAGSSYLQAKSQKKAAQQALDAQMAGFNLASPYMGFGFGQGQNALQNALAGGLYQGETIAGLDPSQTGAYNLINQQVGNNTGVGTLASQAGQNLLNAGMGVGANAQNIFNMANPTNTLQTANMYASSNPFINDAVDAGMLSARRQLNEVNIPQTRLEAARTGNPRSTRTAMKEAIFERGVGEKAQALDAQLRQGAFNTGLGQANQDIRNALSANAGLRSGLSQGQNLLGFGQGFGFKQADALSKAGGMMQGQEQKVLDDAQKQFYMGQDRPLNLIGTYLAMINGGRLPQGGVPRDYMNYASQNPMLSAVQGGFGGAQMGQGFSNYFNPFQYGI
tara:strand:+ start:1099 stop:2130 length:1032 start_codon:yes stop_codon:yes gene_type:complete